MLPKDPIKRRGYDAKSVYMRGNYAFQQTSFKGGLFQFRRSGGKVKSHTEGEIWMMSVRVT